MFYEIGRVEVITVITYLIYLGCKEFKDLDNKYIPLICGVTGGILGVIGMYTVPDFPTKDILNSMAIGIVSGLFATKANQISKQLIK